MRKSCWPNSNSVDKTLAGTLRKELKVLNGSLLKQKFSSEEIIGDRGGWEVAHIAEGQMVIGVV